MSVSQSFTIRSLGINNFYTIVWSFDQNCNTFTRRNENNRWRQTWWSRKSHKRLVAGACSAIVDSGAIPCGGNEQEAVMEMLQQIEIDQKLVEMELQIEMQCREIMQSNDLDNIKRYCTHLVRKKFDQDIFMASLLNRLIELEANRVVAEMRKVKPKNPLKKFFRIR